LFSQNEMDAESFVSAISLSCNLNVYKNDLLYDIFDKVRAYPEVNCNFFTSSPIYFSGKIRGVRLYIIYNLKETECLVLPLEEGGSLLIPPSKRRALVTVPFRSLNIV